MKIKLHTKDCTVDPVCIYQVFISERLACVLCDKNSRIQLNSFLSFMRHANRWNIDMQAKKIKEAFTHNEIQPDFLLKNIGPLFSLALY